MAEDWYPEVGFYFTVSFEGVSDAYDTSFKEASGISAEVGSDKLTEGGVNNFTWQVPTSVSYSNLVLKRGMMAKKSALTKWVETTVNTDYSSPIEVKTIVLKLLNEKGKPRMSWSFYNARPVKWQVADFDSQKNDVLVETMEFNYTFFKKNY